MFINDQQLLVIIVTLRDPNSSMSRLQEMILKQQKRIIDRLIALN